jgi:hypothetical protein
LFLGKSRRATTFRNELSNGGELWIEQIKRFNTQILYKDPQYISAARVLERRRKASLRYLSTMKKAEVNGENSTKLLPRSE